MKRTEIAMYKLPTKIATIALVGALASVTFGVAQSASADLVSGPVVVTPTSGNVSDADFLSSFTAPACPVGFRTASVNRAYQNGVNMGGISLVRDPSTTFGDLGLSGQPMRQDRVLSPTNGYVSNKPLDQLTTPLVAGDWELRVYCGANFPGVFNYATDAWFALPMTLDAGGNWAVKGTVTPPTTAPTTTSLTAVGDDATKRVALEATIKKADGTKAADAVGTVQFLKDGVAVGSPVTVAGGVASYTTDPQSAGTYSFTSVFTSSNTAYSGSTSTASSVTVVAVVVVPPGAQVGTAVIDVTVPTNTGSVSFAGLASSISLGTAVLDGGFFKASGQLGTVTVTDTRQLGSTPWSLTGTVTDFKDGTKILDGKYLGWKPTLVGTPNAGTAGAEVLSAPSTVAGLKAPASVLTSGSVVDGAQTTKVGADLKLVAPGNTPGGFYKSTLTLTLVS